ncbi:MAG: hypothetical protein HUJ76_01850 [Parasporobacterium sp.]|nr:hypothetical protein [Parasporobacterium sp.]
MSDRIIFKNPKTGIYFLRTEAEDNVSVKIMDSDGTQLGTESYGLYEYRFRNVSEYQHPYMSWANLDCCNGWKYDPDYLLHAVQEGRKLVAQENFAGTVLEGKTDEEIPGILSLDPETVSWQIAVNSVQTEDPDCKDPRGIIIARKGALKDYYNFDDIMAAYAEQEITFSPEMQEQIGNYMEAELISLFTFAFSFGIDILPLPVTGMGLGYPLESTAALLIR